MDLEILRDTLLDYPETTEEQPFGPDVVVYKVKGKMFALVAYEAVPPSMNLKCEPDQALEWRDRWDAVTPGYHMNKKHWNTIKLDGELTDEWIFKMMDHSFLRVVTGMPKTAREALISAWEEKSNDRS